MSSRMFAALWMSACCALVACGGDDTAGSTGGGGGTTTGQATTGGTGGAGGAGATGTTGSGTSSTGTGATSTATGTASTGAGGGVPDTCVACVQPLLAAQGACVSAEDACKADADCSAWMDCTGACFNMDFTATCWNACDAAHPSSANLHDALVTCICNPCSAECGPICG